LYSSDVRTDGPKLFMDGGVIQQDLHVPVEVLPGQIPAGGKSNAGAGWPGSWNSPER
jgi:hypothetical protein